MVSVGVAPSSEIPSLSPASVELGVKKPTISNGLLQYYISGQVGAKS